MESPKPSRHPSPEHALYFDTLLKADMLGRRLESSAQPVASSLFYRVDDPRVIDSLVLPAELPQHAATSVCIEIEERPQDPDSDLLGTIASTTVIIEFGDEGTCRIPVTDDLRPALRYDVLPELDSTAWRIAIDPETNQPKPLVGILRRQELSDLIARLVLPDHDPSTADYTRLDIDTIRQAIVRTLEETDYVMVDKVHHYEVLDWLITVSKQGEDINEVSIEQRNPESPGVATALRTELDHHSHRQEIVTYDFDTAILRPALSDNIAEFNHTMTKLLDYFAVDTESYEAHAAIVRGEEYTDKKAPEERNSPER